MGGLSAVLFVGRVAEGRSEQTDVGLDFFSHSDGFARRICNKPFVDHKYRAKIINFTACLVE